MAFSVDGLVLGERASAGLEAAGISVPTSPQAAAIPALLAGQTVVIQAATGTGKTLAYLLPLLQELREDPTLRAVVVAPGAELAMQIHRVLDTLRDEDLVVGAVVSTSNTRRQKKRITKSTRLIVGTPDRILTMFREKKMKGVRRIVLDEIEPILAARGASFLEVVLSRSEPVFRLTIAAATLGARSEQFIQQFMPDAIRVDSVEKPLLENIKHVVVPVRSGSAKHMSVARFLEQNRCKRAILFAREARQQSFLYHYLQEQGFKVVTVSRDRTKGDRERGLRAFRNGDADVLITTDASARGLDVPGVDWILHFDVPHGSEAYTHRAGRTGRAGEKGTSVVFVEPKSQRTWEKVVRRLKLETSVPR